MTAFEQLQDKLKATDPVERARQAGYEEGHRHGWQEGYDEGYSDATE